MSKRKRVEPTWAIYRLASKTIYLGQVTAPDEDKAVKVAIKELPVTNPNHWQKLAARKMA